MRSRTDQRIDDAELLDQRAAPGDELESSCCAECCEAEQEAELHRGGHRHSDKISESYYTALPATFTIAPGATRVAHFDATGATDHFPVNKYSLFSTSKNALDVEVVVSTIGAAVQTTTLKKDAGRAENPSE